MCYATEDVKNGESNISQPVNHTIWFDMQILDFLTSIVIDVKKRAKVNKYSS